MPKISTLLVSILLMTFALASGADAQTGSSGLNPRISQQVKASLNTMVQEVHAAESPATKHAILTGFLGKVERGAVMAKHLPFLSAENRTALNVLQGKFGQYAADLRSMPEPGTSRDGVAEGDLDSYASYVQQDLEQASSGGVYLSTGAIIIVLLIILILM
jgi:hypothetical protein